MVRVVETSKHFVQLMKKARKQQECIEKKVFIYTSLAADLKLTPIVVSDVNNGKLFWMEHDSIEGYSL